MKFLPYLKWRWNKVDIWDKLYTANLLLVPVGLFFPKPYNLIAFSLFFVNMSVLLVWILKDHFKFSYGEFEKEQNKILEVLKNSEQK